MSTAFNSVENIVNQSIKYHLAYMERALLDSIPSFSEKTIVPFTVEFKSTCAENHPVIKQTAEFFFSAFNWQGCRIGGSADLIFELPSRDFTVYSITFFIEMPYPESVRKIITILEEKRLARLKPKLTRDPVLHSAVSQRVARYQVNPATIIEILS